MTKPGTLQHSSLRRAILLALAKQPVQRLTDFAEQIGHLRPSVSRCLWTLRAKGLVKLDGNAWTLTEQGQQAAAKAKTHPYEELSLLTGRLASLAEKYAI